MAVATIGPDRIFRMAGFQCRAALGAGGITGDKREGDRATPAGLLPLRRVLYRADRLAPPRCAVPVEPIAPDDGWCDDPDDPAYNRMIRLPAAAHAERLWRDDPLYDVIGVLGWNDRPPVRERGSAIFLHLARGDHAPTAGCIALARDDLLRALAAGLDAIEVG
jgi:L,D-peptidoglycan transpeptidase YkuD (ErfK/YbiS/YcfS/YnhG family)